MTVYEQVEKMLNESEKRPEWVDEMLFELREIKRLLQESRQKHKRNKDFFRFINRLREKMRADIANDIYPEIHFKSRILGINFKGYIYDKYTTKELTAQEAYEVYRFLYDNQERLDDYFMIS